ncbi:MAG: hypothetical protein M1380_04055 [Chloroflexi bacterium]|nr:hypothetical protein [Chloroflexota bacterium]
MITKHVGGEVVKGGIYWSMSAGEFVSVPREGGRLAGSMQDSYLRAPLPVVLVVGPIMGLAFAIFLPLSGLLVLVPFLADKLRGALIPSAAHAAAGTTLQPGISYLEPRPRTAPEERPTETPEQGKLVDLAKEIAEKRWQDR